MSFVDIIHIILLIIITLLFISSFYVGYNLASTNFEEILFYSLSKSEAKIQGEYDPVIIAIKKCAPFIIILFLLLYSLFFGYNSEFENSFLPLLFVRDHKTLFILLLLFLSLMSLLNSVGLFNYLHYIIQKSNVIEDNYVNPKEVNVNFDKKKNLILIFVESLENTILSKEHGGVWDYEIISELHNLLEDRESVNFFDSNNHGMYMIRGSSYTSSSLFSNNSGIPVIVGLNRKGYTKKKYMGGAYALGELLKKHGYTNEVISGANTSYGGLKDFYKQHGDYNIIDIDNINNYDFNITDKDKCSWGFNDRFLLEVAKKRLDKLSKGKKPFNLQLITIDTHFVDGFVGEYSETKFKHQYENAFATTSRLIKDFVDYVKKQPYYKDTTIVIVGDHLIMQSDFVNDKMSNNRTVYNCYINPYNKPIKKKRTYTPLDTFPTILSSIGAKIDGDKLGLGVNLFSKEITLAEKYGFKKLNNELKKKSLFYDKEILQIKK